MANNCSNSNTNSCSPCTGCEDIISSECITYDSSGISGLTYSEGSDIGQMIYAIGTLAVQTRAIVDALISIAPVYTTAQRDLLTPVQGQMIYNTTTVTFQGYNGVAWVSFY